MDFDKLWTCRGVAANHSEPLYHVTTTSLYVIAKLDVVVNNKQFMQLSTASLIDAYHEPTLWDSNVNVTDEK